MRRAAVVASATVVAVAASWMGLAQFFGGNSRTTVSAPGNTTEGPRTANAHAEDDRLPEYYAAPTFPDPASVPSPIVEGPFRIVSFGWPGGSENTYAPIGQGGETSTSSDEDALKDDPLYVDVTLPGALSVDRFVRATKAGDEVVELRISLTIKSAQGRAGIEIARWRPVLPFNVERPADNGQRLFELGTVGGAPAVFYKSPPKAAVSNSIWFIVDGVLTQLSGGVAFDDLMEIAEAIR
jgi:hypothetical protein